MLKTLIQADTRSQRIGRYSMIVELKNQNQTDSPISREGEQAVYNNAAFRHNESDA